MNDNNIWQQLAEPFPSDVVKERQGPKRHEGNCTKQYGRCTQNHMMLSYVDARDVAERLDAVLTPAAWSFESSAVPNTNVVHGRLMVWADAQSMTVREDHGYPNSDSDEEPLKSATSDALKRCAVLFGIGRHLYDDNHPQRPAVRPVVAPTPIRRPLSEQEERNLQAPDDDFPWDGLVTGSSTAAGLNSRDFFDRLDKAQIDRKEATNVAKRMFGANKWKILDLTDAERAALWDELDAPVPA